MVEQIVVDLRRLVDIVVDILVVVVVVVDRLVVVDKEFVDAAGDTCIAAHVFLLGPLLPCNKASINSSTIHHRSPSRGRSAVSC